MSPEAKIGIEDIEDVTAFVGSIVRRKRELHGTFGEVDELVQEGVAIVFELHKKWDPERCERFSAFCLTYVPLRLIDWIRREMRQGGFGARSGTTMRYYGRVSLDSMSEERASSDRSLTVWSFDD